VYSFQAGRSGNVRVSDRGTTGAINVDAVKFVPVTALERAPRPRPPPAPAGQAAAFNAVRLRLVDMLTRPPFADESDADVDEKVRSADFQAHTWWLTM